MKVTKVDIQVVKVPLPKPIPSAWLQLTHVSCVLLSLETDAGVTGQSMIFTLNDRKIGVMRELVRSLEPLAIGSDPAQSGEFLQKVWREITFFGRSGLTLFGLAAYDNALWDLRGKIAGLNIADMVGSCRSAVPIYVSGSMRLSAGIDDLQREASEILARGFRAMKMSLGKRDPKEDVARVKAVREAIGPDTLLMADVNQQLSVPQAIRLGRMLEEFSLGWIEEPVLFSNHEGEALVAAALDTPIASGESEFGRQGMLEMLRLRAADILMPDLQRIGGATEFYKVASLAEAHNIPVSSHLFTFMSLSLMASIPNGLLLEYMPWFDELYDDRLELNADGAVVVPKRPGWGFSFDPSAVSRFLSE